MLIPPKINWEVFPNTPASSVVWSGSPLAGNPNGAWFVYFSNGNANYDLRGYGDRVRLVRGGQSFALLSGATATATALAGQQQAFDPITLAPSVIPGQAWGGARISGEGNPEFQVNGAGAWVKEAIVKSGDQIKVRLTAAASGTHTATLTVRSGQTTGTSDDAMNQSGGTLPLEATAMQETTASFELSATSYYSITATANPAAGGTVSCSPSSVTYGGSSTCTATANANYRFSAWAGACASQSATCTLSDIQAAQTSSAVFVYELTVPEGPQTGQSIAVTPPAQNNWSITSASTAPTSSTATPPPSMVELPYGIVSLKLDSGTQGSTATVVLTYPEPLPAGTTY